MSTAGRLRALSDWQVERVRDGANAELARRAAADYVTLTEAARLLGISKGSVHHAVTRGEIRSLRLMPPEGRSSIVLLVHRGDVVAYEPRVYPRVERAS